MKNFKTFDLAIEFYHHSRCLAFKGYVKNQFDRASYSIPLNLAEGRGRHTLKDQKRFFNIAMGSLRECQAILMLEGLKKSEAWKMLDKVAASLYLLIERAR